ncbi:response regulator [Deltaproteobacteria bacterium TL4]
MRPQNILLVDDEESILKSFSKELNHAGYKVTTAVSGEDAISKLTNHHFDLLVTDLAMPGVGGITVLQAAKKQDAEIRAIILTGYGDLTSAIEALRLGADDYLLKPCNIEELLLRIKRCFEKQEAFRKVKLYENILPVCMYCKNIRDDSGTEIGKGKWISMEEYLHLKSGTDVSHGCCPQCFEIYGM